MPEAAEGRAEVTPEQWARVFRAGAQKSRHQAANEDLRRNYPDGALMLSALAFTLDALSDEAGTIAEADTGTIPKRQRRTN